MDFKNKVVGASSPTEKKPPKSKVIKKAGDFGSFLGKASRDNVQHIAQYDEDKDEFYIVIDNVRYPCVWNIKTQPSGYLYSHPRNDMHDPWMQITWRTLTTKVESLEAIFKQWSPMRPGDKLEVAIVDGSAVVVKVKAHKIDNKRNE